MPVMPLSLLHMRNLGGGQAYQVISPLGLDHPAGEGQTYRVISPPGVDHPAGGGQVYQVISPILSVQEAEPQVVPVLKPGEGS
jgi:hypothetical protein